MYPREIVDFQANRIDASNEVFDCNARARARRGARTLREFRGPDELKRLKTECAEADAALAAAREALHAAELELSAALTDWRSGDWLP